MKDEYLLNSSFNFICEGGICGASLWNEGSTLLLVATPGIDRCQGKALCIMCPSSSSGLSGFKAAAGHPIKAPFTNREIRDATDRRRKAATSCSGELNM